MDSAALEYEGVQFDLRGRALPEVLLGRGRVAGASHIRRTSSAVEGPTHLGPCAVLADASHAPHACSDSLLPALADASAHRPWLVVSCGARASFGPAQSTEPSKTDTVASCNAMTSTGRPLAPVPLLRVVLEGAATPAGSTARRIQNVEKRHRCVIGLGC